jgi:hypothetical protein
VDNVVSDEVRRLVAAGVSSVDHVDVLFHLRSGEGTVSQLAAVTRFDAATVSALLADLERIGLVSRNGGCFALTQSRRERGAIEDLLAVYNARPVTLVRVLYRAGV